MPPKIDASVFEDLGRLIDAEENPVDSTPRPEFRPLLGKAQGEAYDSDAKYLLLYGERYSGKSHLGGGYKLVKHLWRNFNALAIILVCGVAGYLLRRGTPRID